MDVATSATSKMATDIGVNIAGGTGIALLGGFVLWFRKLIGIPKRVKILEATIPVMLESISALTKHTLAQSQHRRESDKSPGVVRAEELLRTADERMDEYMRQGLMGGKS